MAVLPVDRCQIILDLLKDGDTVAGDAAYASLDQVTPAVMDKWAQPLYERNAWLQQTDGDGAVIPYASLTNPQQARVIMNFIRRRLREEREAWRGTVDAKTARDSAVAAAAADADTDLGPPE